jgi:integrase
MGLGGWPTVSLAAARDDALQCRRWLRAGLDPRVERKRDDRNIPTFKEAASRYADSHAAGWVNRHRVRWLASLDKHAYPKIGDLPVNEIMTDHVLAVLTPLWDSKTETASRVRQRIEKVLDACAVRGERSSENPARWRGHLEAILPKKNAVATVKHFRSMPWSELPKFMVALKEKAGVGARALEFTILTAARSGETRGAAWDEIDLDGKTWTIPATRMKTGREHRIPLSTQVIALLKSLSRIDDGNLVFQSPTTGRQLSDGTLNKVLKDLGRGETVHGFRSTFRDWCSDDAKVSREIAEAALSHVIKNQVEAAYSRSDHLKRRRTLMNRWGRYCASTPVEKVVKIEGRR